MQLFRVRRCQTGYNAKSRGHGRKGFDVMKYLAQWIAASVLGAVAWSAAATGPRIVYIAPSDGAADPTSAYIDPMVQHSLSTALQAITTIKDITPAPAVRVADAAAGAKAASDAGATHLIFQSHTVSGPDLHLRARLVELATGKIIGEATADGNSRDLFSLEDTLSRQIAALLDPAGAAAPADAAKTTPGLAADPTSPLLALPPADPPASPAVGPNGPPLVEDPVSAIITEDRRISQDVENRPRTSIMIIPGGRSNIAPRPGPIVPPKKPGVGPRIVPSTPPRQPGPIAASTPPKNPMKTPQNVGMSTPQPVQMKTPQNIGMSTPQGIPMRTPQGIGLSTPQDIRLSTPQGNPLGTNPGNGNIPGTGTPATPGQGYLPSTGSPQIILIPGLSIGGSSFNTGTVGGGIPDMSSGPLDLSMSVGGE